jgi:hypothetical protein
VVVATIRAMSELGPASAEASVTISASCAEVYGLITDLTAMASLAAEVEQMEWYRGDRAEPGSAFKGYNANGPKKWTTTCTVTDAEPGQVFAFDVKTARVVPIAHWRYDIVPVEGGCTVTERTWDRRPRWILKPAAMSTGISDRTGANSEHIRVTLERLKARAEAEA